MGEYLKLVLGGVFGAFLVLQGCGSNSDSQRQLSTDAVQGNLNPDSLFEITQPATDGGNSSANGAPYSGNITVLGNCDPNTNLKIVWEIYSVTATCVAKQFSGTITLGPGSGTIPVVIIEEDAQSGATLATLQRNLSVNMPSQFTGGPTMGPFQIPGYYANGRCDPGYKIQVKSSGTATNPAQSFLVDCSVATGASTGGWSAGLHIAAPQAGVAASPITITFTEVTPQGVAVPGVAPFVASSQG